MISDYTVFVASRMRPVEETYLTCHDAAIHHMLSGIVTEAGELFDIFKRHHFYGQPFDTEHASEEIGDLSFYIAGLCHLLEGYGCPTWDQILEQNVAKLTARYPDGYTDQAAAERADKGGEA
jgi:NTP pyrophosphatase (non-canonical NTP hydrolase)